MMAGRVFTLLGNCHSNRKNLLLSWPKMMDGLGVLVLVLGGAVLELFFFSFVFIYLCQ